ncbi:MULTISPECIES: nuclear transport factor 2 family protein [Rhizobium]|uniref:nuclear transport factor 2 family protein n=1 Tax=Rhizobium TaxID=379 RepID=UPI000406A384|nr:MULTISPECIES: nuclear transport factor 2 family protein [Rhizobium]
MKVRLRIHSNVFIDHLCFVKGIEGWRIVAKVWHLETVRVSLPASQDQALPGS